MRFLVTNMLFSKTFLYDDEKLCSLPCPGIEERRDDSNYVFNKFKKTVGSGTWGNL